MANVSIAALLGRMIVSLGVVVGLMFVVAKVARKRLGTGRRAGDATSLQVLSRQVVGKGAAVTLVRAGDRALLLGVTEHSVSLLAETDLPPEPAADPVSEPAPAMLAPPLANLVQRARDLTVRRV